MPNRVLSSKAKPFATTSSPFGVPALGRARVIAADETWCQPPHQEHLAASEAAASMGGAGSNGVLGFEPAVVARLALAGLVAQGFFMFGMHAVAAFVLGGKGLSDTPVSSLPGLPGHLLLFACRTLLAAHRKILALPGLLGVIIAHL